MSGAGVTRRSVDWVFLLLGWVALAGPIGLVMYAVTTFLSAFSGGQYRMVPIVAAGPWLVAVVSLLVGAVVLAATRSLPRALGAVLGSIVVTWPVAVVAYWVVADRLGANPPRFGF